MTHLPRQRREPRETLSPNSPNLFRFCEEKKPWRRNYGRLRCWDERFHSGGIVEMKVAREYVSPSWRFSSLKKWSLLSRRKKITDKCLSLLAVHEIVDCSWRRPAIKTAHNVYPERYLQMVHILGYEHAAFCDIERKQNKNQRPGGKSNKSEG